MPFFGGRSCPSMRSTSEQSLATGGFGFRCFKSRSAEPSAARRQRLETRKLTKAAAITRTKHPRIRARFNAVLDTVPYGSVPDCPSESRVFASADAIIYADGYHQHSCVCRLARGPQIQPHSPLARHRRPGAWAGVAAGTAVDRLDRMDPRSCLEQLVSKL